MNPIRNLSRRSFLQISGGGAVALVVGVHLRGCAPPDGGPPAEFRPNVFISLDSTGGVTITANRAEMGQGIRTSLPMVVADEMEADWARVAVVQSDAADWPIWRAVSTDLVYVRLHGHRQTYVSPYATASLARWAARCRGWLAEGRQVHVYFDNTAEGHALRDAARLRKRVAGDVAR